MTSGLTVNRDFSTPEADAMVAHGFIKEVTWLLDKVQNVASVLDTLDTNETLLSLVLLSCIHETASWCSRQGDAVSSESIAKTHYQDWGRCFGWLLFSPRRFCILRTTILF